MRICPCKNCQKHMLGCHVDCFSYIDWKIDHDKEKESIDKAKSTNLLMADYRMAQKEKLRRARNLK